MQLMGTDIADLHLITDAVHTTSLAVFADVYRLLCQNDVLFRLTEQLPLK
jgi:hypothetical protein